jgi:replication-associated recombination protein RarA
MAHVPTSILPVIGQWPLVGRSEELAVIADATRVADDHVRGIVLSGSAGVGKTRVARGPSRAAVREVRAGIGSSAPHRHAASR